MGAVRITNEPPQPSPAQPNPTQPTSQRTLSLSGLDDAKHFGFVDGLDLGQGYLPLAGLLLALLLDHVGEDLGAGLLLTVQQVRGHGSLLDRLVVGLVLVVALLVHFDAVYMGGYGGWWMVDGGW